MDFSDVSNRDIDGMVLQKIYGNQSNDKDIMRAWMRGGFKYTTSPADAWPIIEENSISIIKYDATQWRARHRANIRGSISTNPLRAAMIVFLEMQA